jgi:hypothetical protein
MTVSAATRTLDCGQVVTIGDCEQIPYGEARLLPRDRRSLRVISGYAWVSIDGRDYVLARNEEIPLKRGRHPAIVTALGNRPLVYETQ